MVLDWGLLEEGGGGGWGGGGWAKRGCMAMGVNVHVAESSLEEHFEKFSYIF